MSHAGERGENKPMTYSNHDQVKISPSNASKKEPYAWLCKNGHGNSHHELNCFYCGAKQ